MAPIELKPSMPPVRPMPPMPSMPPLRLGPAMPRRRALLVAACAGTTVAVLGASAPSSAAAAAAAASAASAPSAPGGHPWLPISRRVGQGALRWLAFTVYEASLFALPDFDAAAYAAHPLVLELHYRRAFTGSDIAEYSLQEMRRAAPVDEAAAGRWLQFMRRAFPDVAPGDRLTGMWIPGSATSRFAANDAAPVALQDAGFGPRFFGIWLAPQTSRPELRERLLGLRPRD